MIIDQFKEDTKLNIIYDTAIPKYKEYKPTAQKTAQIQRAVEQFLNSNHQTVRFEFDNIEETNHFVSMLFLMGNNLKVFIHIDGNNVYLEKDIDVFNDGFTIDNPEEFIKKLFNDGKGTE